MHRLLLLERTMRKCSGSMFASLGMGSISVDTDLPKVQRILQYAGLTVLAGVVMFFIGRFSMGIFEEFAADGLETLAYEGICVALMLLCLFLAAQKSLSLFFLSGDNETLIHMPIRPGMIAFAKAVVIYRSCVMATAIIGIPILAAAQIASGGTVISFVAAVLVPLLLPIPPVFYVVLLSIIMMRYIQIGKSKEARASTITVIFMLIMFLAPQLFNFMQKGVSAGGGIEATVESLSNIIRMFEYIFPTTFLAVGSLQEGGIFALLLLVAAMLLIVAVYAWIAEKLYLKAILRTGHHGSKQKVADEKTIQRYGRTKRSVKKAYARKERQLLFRTPVFFLQSVLLSLVVTVMFAGLCVFLLVEMMSEITEIGNMELGSYEAYIWYGALGVVLLISALAVAFTHVTSTCISREGKNFPYMKTMPVPMETQLAVKSRIGLYMAIAGALPFLVIMNYACLLLSVSPLFVPVSLILSMSVLIMGNDVQTYLDCSSPILNWENEYAAAVNNHLLGSAVGPLLFVAALLGIGAGLYLIFKTMWLPVIGIVLVAAVAGSWVLHRWLYAKAVKCMEDL
ncbi:MAG: hypothetical protein PHS82_01085 [Lachnospiraceae bacterium]|nr:hypothetical protein [Lachnospiraceae bacterium]